jgi:hypothetical protein
MFLFEQCLRRCFIKESLFLPDPTSMFYRIREYKTKWMKSLYLCKKQNYQPRDNE